MDNPQRQTFARSVGNAFAGVRCALRSERNVKIDVCIAIVAIALGFVFRVSAGEWLAIIICCGLVLGLELVNTSIEALVDLVSPDKNELAGRAKDCAAGACLIAAFAALLVGIIIFAPKILALLF